MGQALPGDARPRRSRRGDPATPGILTLALVLLLQGGPTAVRVGPVNVVAWPGQLDEAIGLADLAGRPVSWPALGRRTPDPFRLIVVPDQAHFRRLSRGRVPSWGAGLTMPDSRTIVLRANAGDLPQVLRHELAHLALHDAVRGNLPLWFDEGYAGWAAGEWGRMDGLELNLAVVRGQIPSLGGLNAQLRGSAISAQAAYALATSAVLELARRNPTHTLVPLLTRVSQGESFDAAVLATTGFTVDRFDEAWQRSVRRRYGVITWAVAGGLWSVLAIAVLLLVRVRRIRDRPRRAALDVGWEVPEDDEPPSELDHGDGG